MTLITMTELKNDLKKYTDLAKFEDIIITKQGKPHVKLVNVSRNKTDILNELAGSLPSDIDVEKILEQRLLEL